ncbi:MAG: hypothetical protein AB7F22_14340 [Reyranella sp.]|uniref:hypothetical protein n=1 Tax=Reyranella sp. TaxID=1929291 RepID=UPI003D0FDADE
MSRRSREPAEHRSGRCTSADKGAFRSSSAGDLSPRHTAASVVAIPAILVVNAALRGSWLDELWTLHFSDNSNGLPALMRDGWLRDTHPPIFNAWATLLGALGIGSIAPGPDRLEPARRRADGPHRARFARWQPEQAAFNTTLVLLALSCRRRWKPSSPTAATSGR